MSVVLKHSAQRPDLPINVLDLLHLRLLVVVYAMFLMRYQLYFAVRHLSVSLEHAH